MLPARKGSCATLWDDMSVRLPVRECSLLDLDRGFRRMEQGVADQAMMDGAFYAGALLAR